MPHYPPGYVALIEEMARRAIKWHAENPLLAPVVSWNFSKDILVAMPISAARRAGFVDANPDGWRLLAAMVGPLDPRREPTPTMVRVALEAAKDPEARQQLLRGVP